MTREDTAKVLLILNAAYPAFYSKFSDKEIGGIIDIWAEMFEDDDVNIVKYALKELIATHTGFPPDIAALKGKIKEVVYASVDKPTHEELWVMLKGAAENGYYCAKEEFEKLPPVLKRYVGSPSTLKDYSLMSAETFNTVVHGQFLKQIKVIEDREEYAQRLPDSLKAAISASFKRLEGDRELSEREVNDRRNKILDQLEARIEARGDGE